MKSNLRARKFYEKNGFQISGNEREIEIAECRVSEVEYIYYGLYPLPTVEEDKE